MEEGRTNLVPRLQQDAYLHHFAAAQPGTPPALKNAVANVFDANDAHISSSTGFAGGYPFASSRSSAFPYSAGNHSVVNEYSSNSYAPSTESNTFAQGLPATGIPNRHLADLFDDPNTLRFDANASFSAQHHAFSTGTFDIISPTYAEGGYGGFPAAHQFYSDPSNYNEHPFATGAASIGTNTFAAGSTSHTYGQVVANSAFPIPASNNPIVPLDIGYATEGPIALSPNIYTTGQAIANSPFPMPVSNNTVVPMDIGFTTDGPIALSPNSYTTGQALANNSIPMPMSNNPLIPVDIGPPIPHRPLCTQCNQTFSRQSDLDRHAKKHQSGPKEFKCHVQGCKYESHRKDKLGEHMRRRHAAGGSRLN